MDHLGVFAKYWRPGAVKTRLGREIGMDAAAELYRTMLETTVHRLAEVGDTRTIVFSPASSRGAFARIAVDRWACEPQVEGDLGERMQAFATDALSSGAERVAIVGTDCPHLPPAWVHEAFETLADYDVVLGPSTDGGYYLLGMRRLVGSRDGVPPIFKDIAWSTPEVFSQTVARLAASDLSFAVLNETFDVDDSAGLRKLDDHLRHYDRDEALESLAGVVTSILADE